MFVLALHSNYGAVLYHFRDKARYLSKRHTPLATTPPLRCPSRNIASGLVWKTRIVWLSEAEKKFYNIFNRFDAIPACDKRTDWWGDILRQHSRRSALCIRIAQQQKNSLNSLFDDAFIRQKWHICIKLSK